MPTIQTFAVRETDVSRHKGGASGAPLKPLRDDSALIVWIQNVGKGQSRGCPAQTYTEETRFHFPFKLNGI